ncbi:MAG: CHAT domain-containing protein [Bacteroidales bacterium]|nr:CHAT domain-containing protein [Bacteroidales bacterium]
MILPDYLEDSLSTISFIDGTDSILLSHRSHFLHDNNLNSCALLLRGLANKYLFSKEDSLLLGHYYAKGVCETGDAKDVISLTLNYAKMLSFERRRLVGEVSFPIAKDINDTLAAQSIFRIVEGIIASNEESVSDSDAKTVVEWCKIGQVYAESAFNEGEASYHYLLEKLTYYSWKTKARDWQAYADSLFAYKSRRGSAEIDFEGPFYDSYLNALKESNYDKAESILDYYSRSLINVDSVYVPLNLYLPERPRRDYRAPIDSSMTTSEMVVAELSRDILWPMIKGLLGDKLDLETVCCFEKARLGYLRGDSDYSKWLNRAFYRGVTRTFPATAYEYIDNYLRPEHKYNQGMIDLLTRQYNNDNPKSVYDALLFVKGASEIIPPSIYRDIKQHSPQEIVDYVDSIRVYDIDSRNGIERDFLENEIGVNVKSILHESISSYSDIKSCLKPTDVAIEFYAAPSLDLAENYSYRATVLCADYDEPAIVEICSNTALRDLLLNKELYSKDRAYQVIIAPLEKYLDGKNTVYFSMDGLLYLCNLPALLTPKGTRLGQDYVFKQLTSTRVILSFSDTTPCKSIALFGGIDYDGDSREDRNNSNLLSVNHVTPKSLLRSFNRSDFSPLPFSRQEIDDISQQAASNGLSVQYFSAEDGTECALKNLSGKTISILHIATHGFYYSQKQSQEISYLNMINQDDNPLNRCGLLLAGSKNTWKNGKSSPDKEDGILFGEEIAKLDFTNVDLVVLSACKSALGDINSEGVTGLRQAFKRAGVRSILITLNNVDDQATAFFMRAFYEKLFTTKDKYEAYEYAINQMKSSTEFSSASYWAPFVLID